MLVKLTRSITVFLRHFWFAAPTFALVCFGCSEKGEVNKDRASASGTVTIEGQPLPAGTIVFATAEGNIASTVSIKSGGHYSTDRAPIGSNVVTIDNESIKMGNPAAYVPIPAKYADPTASGLTADIKPGANENVNFDLKK